jgi:VWFA-related protein
MIALLAGCLLAQTAADQPMIRTSANEVLVDVVVRDKKGKLVRGLSAADFEVFENGSGQRIMSVREVSGATIAGPARAGGAIAVDPSRTIRLFTLAFDRLGVDSRRLARQAALDMLKQAAGPNVFFAVFFTDQSLRVLQPFTNDHGKVKSAIGRATSGAPTDRASGAMDLELAASATQGGEGAADAAANSRGGPVDGGGMAAEAMNRMVRDMLEFTRTSLREQVGRSSIFALWGIVQEQNRLPGRKTLLYFSEGLQVPNSLQNQFRNMISAANRANVSVYAIDARGLSVQDDNDSGRQMLDASTRVSMGTYRNQGGTPVTREEVQQFDRAEDSIRANPQLALAELAESTGGFLIANSNDFRQPLRRLAEEIGSYYEIVYRPSNMALDGTYRAIEVKSARDDLKLQARAGYYALPSSAVSPHEVPLLNALATSPPPRGLDFRAAVVRFRPSPAGRESMIVFDMPLSEITFRESADKSSYRTHFSFLALIKDERGEVVGKISRDLPLDEPADRLEGFRMGRAIFTQPAKLAPGRYTLEAAVADRIGEKVAARRVAVVMPSAGPRGVALSGLTLARRIDKAPPEPEAGDGFIAGARRVIPTLADRVPGGAGRALSLYFVVYPAAGGVKPMLTIEFFRDAEKLGGGSPELPAPEPDGRIPYIATTPLDAFPPGQYEVRVRVQQGGASDEQSAFVTIE